jgi:hypothetical protein
MGTRIWAPAPIVAAVGALALVACGASGQSVALSVAPRAVEQAIVIEGTTDLPDGALIAYEVTHDAFGTSDDLQDSTWDLFADGSVPVQGGRYSVNVPVAGWPSGRVTVWVAFQTVLGATIDGQPADGQPADVIERYGNMGENLTGSNVSESGDSKRVELEQTIQLP